MPASDPAPPRQLSASSATVTTTPSSASNGSIVAVHEPPMPALLAYETLRFSHRLVYNKEDVVGFLTSHRILLLAASSGKTLFAIPVSIIASHNISAQTPKQPQVMLRIVYIPPPSANIPPPPNPDPAAAPQRNVVLTFTSSTAIQDRLQWKEAIAAIQSKNQLSSSSSSPSAAAGRTTTPSPPPATSPTVKKEPAQAAVAAAGGSGSASSSSSSSTPPSSSASSISSSASKPPSSSTPPPVATTTISMSTLETRASLLARHAQLKQLHTDLVLGKVISEEEFWSSPSHTELIRREADAAVHQQVGLSSSMQADITPSVTSTSVHFKVDANTMHAIFLSSPAVHRAYGQLVPTKMSEKEFWTKYFKSRYVHANRSALMSTADDRGGGAGGEGIGGGGDAFGAAIDAAERKVEEEQAATDRERRVKAIIQRKHVDPSVDLTSADADEAVMTGQPTILNHDHSQSDAAKEGRKLSKKARAQMELINKWNRHGMLVLEATAGKPKDGDKAAAAGGEAGSRPLVKEEEEKYHHDLSESLTLKDLQLEPPVQYEVLPLQRKDYSKDIGKRKSAKTAEEDSRKAEDMTAFLHEVERFDPDSIRHAMPDPHRSLALVNELSMSSRALNRAAFLTQQIHARQSTLALDSDVATAPDTASSSSSSSPSTAPLPVPVVFSTTSGADVVVPTEFQTELRKHFVTCQELSRHFYAAFPVTERTRDKLERVKLALDQSYQRLLMLQQDLNRQGQTALVPIVAPLLTAIERCDSLYTKWREAEKLKQRIVEKQQTAAGPSA